MLFWFLVFFVSIRFIWLMCHWKGYKYTYFILYFFVKIAVLAEFYWILTFLIFINLYLIKLSFCSKLEWNDYMLFYFVTIVVSRRFPRTGLPEYSKKIKKNLEKHFKWVYYAIYIPCSMLKQKIENKVARFLMFYVILIFSIFCVCPIYMTNV